MSEKLVKCKSCGEEIAGNVKVCSECGAKIKKPIYKKIWFWIIIISVVFGMMLISVAAGLIGGNIGYGKLPLLGDTGSIACGIEEYREKMNRVLEKSDFSSYTIGDFEEVDAKSRWEDEHLYKAKIADVEIYLVTLGDSRDDKCIIHQTRYKINLNSKNFKLFGFLYGANLRLLYPQIDDKETEVFVKKLGLSNPFEIKNNKCNFYDSLLRSRVKDNNLTLYISENCESFEEDYIQMEPLVKVNVIDMSAMTEADIDKWAAENKINISRENKYSDTVEKGKFISQSIKANGNCYQGDKITLVYSLGKEPTAGQKNALKKAESYSSMQHMSKQRLYKQLTSEHGEQFTAEEAQYAIDHLGN